MTKPLAQVVPLKGKFEQRRFAPASRPSPPSNAELMGSRPYFDTQVWAIGPKAHKVVVGFKEE